MPSSRALIIDRNEEFRELARSVLEVLHLKADFADNGKAGLQSLGEREPAIVLLAVEQPKKRGFALFTQIKNMTKKVPIVIATSTVPMEDMLLHQKLRLHADAYLDKRGLGEAQLLRVLNALLGLKLDPSEISALSTQAARKRRKTGTPAGTIADDDIAATLAALEELDPEPDDSPEPSPEPPRAQDEDETVRLRREIDELRDALEAARRAAGSSPFSDEYMQLSEKADRADRQMSRLRAEIDSRTEQASALERKLAAAAKKLVDEERARREAVERADDLERRLRSTEQDLERARARASDLEGRLAASAEASKTAALEQERAAQSMRAEYAAAAESLRKKLDEDHRRALEETRAKHSEEIAGLRSAHEQALARSEREHAEALERKNREGETALREAAEERKRALAAASQELAVQLECAENKRRSDLEEQAALHRTEIGKAEEKSRREVEKVRAAQREEIESLERAKAEADALAHRQATKAAEAYDALLREKQETQRLRAQLQEEIDRLRTSHARDRRLMEQEQARALESLAERLRDEGPEKPRKKSRYRVRKGSDPAPEPQSADPELLMDLLESVQTLDGAAEDAGPDADERER